MTRFLLAAALLASPLPAMAQSPAPVAAQPAPSTEQLAAADKLMTALMPPNQREAMIEQMMAAMMTNMVAGVRDAFNLEKLLADQPEARGVFDRFVARQQKLATDDLKVNFPSMIDAMARAYARRFTTAQMAEMEAFFSTPTGRLYMTQSIAIMSDPDIAAWQRRVMAESMSKLPQQMEALKTELDALKKRDSSDGS